MWTRKPWTGAYLSVAVLILLIAAFGPDPGFLALPIFAASIGLAIWDGLRILVWKQVACGLLVLAAAVTLFVCSLVPWYVSHRTPRDSAPHRHHLWELGHDH